VLWKALIPAEQRIPTRSESRSLGKRKSVPFETLRYAPGRNYDALERRFEAACDDLSEKIDGTSGCRMQHRLA
jgi:hypothetical protein